MISGLNYFFSWYFFIVLIGWLVLPITFNLFRRIPDRGYSLSKVVGLLLISFIHWFMNSLGLSQNTPGGIWAAIVILFFLSALGIKRERIASFKKWVYQQSAYILISEFVFIIAFLGMVWLRSYNPDILGTEKPMELMFINSILNSPTFPPQDAWLAGYSISYYYFGYVMMALIGMLTATPAGITFNLAISLIFALSFTSAFGILLNLIGRMNHSLQSENFRLVRWVPISLLAPFVLLLVGNFYGILDVLHQHHLLAEVNVPGITFQTGKTDPQTQAVIPPKVVVGNNNFWEWMDLKQLGPIPAEKVPFQGIQQGNWFFASRTIHDRNLMGYDPEAIDEFPAFSFLLADLHPHVLALPFVLLVILLCFEWFIDLRQRKLEDNPAPIQWYRIFLSAIILGSLIFLNTWDFPFYVFLFGLGGFLAFFFHRDESWDWNGLILYLLPVGKVILLGVLLYVPFLITFQSQAGGVIPNVIYPTKFRQLFVMFGPLIIGVVILLLSVLKNHKREIELKTGWKLTLGFLVIMILITSLLVLLMLSNPETATLVNGAIAPFQISEALGWLLLRRVVEGLTLLFGLLLLAGGIAILWGQRKQGSESVLFVFAMVTTGTLLLLGPEFVYLRDNFGWRMNTLFKFYFQIWILWSLSASFGCYYVWKQMRGWRRTVGISLMTLGFLTGLVYTIGTIQTTTQNMRNSVQSNGSQQPTLDGLAFYSLYYPDDWALIQWLNTNIDKPTVILEGTKGAYWIDGRSSRVSMITGLPTIMGWVNHEAQWRGEDFSEVANRENDIRLIYTERDWSITEDLLDLYQVEYVVFTPLEREWYGGIQQSKFDQHMQRVFEFGDFIIYKR